MEQEDDNFRPSTARAKRGFDFLVEKNIQVERLTYHGFGETMPLQSNEHKQGRTENRRVEFVVVKE